MFSLLEITIVEKYTSNSEDTIWINSRCVTTLVRKDRPL